MSYTQTKLQGSKFLGPLSFYKRALLLALPVMGQLLIQNMVALVDNFMVAGLGDIKMSGVNIAGQINFVFLIFINTICHAPQSLWNIVQPMTKQLSPLSQHGARAKDVASFAYMHTLTANNSTTCLSLCKMARW